MSEVLLQKAWRLHQAGNAPEAARLYADILRANPRHFDALRQLGLIHLATGRFTDAERLFAMAAQVNPQSAEALYNRGCALQSLGRNEEALASFAHALAVRPEFVEARNNRGVTLLGLKRYREALACFDRVLADRPELGMVHSNRAAALLGLGQYQEALASADAALRAAPPTADALYNRGAALAALGRHEDALSHFDHALSLNTDHADALVHRGIVLALLGRHEEALRSYDRALRRRPGNIEILYNRANSLFALKQFEQAILDCEQILRSAPDFKYVRGNLLHARLHCCDWGVFPAEKAQVITELRAGSQVLHPLQAAAIADHEEDVLRASRIWVASEFPPARDPLWRGERYDHSRLRLAYVSADFRTHAVMTLAAGMFEHHDKARFETTAISLGFDDGSGMRLRLEGAFDHFIEVRGQSDGEVAKLLRDREIDIAVDMMGFTENARTAIFAYRPAGLQVNYLGFPGTMAAPYIDYILADKTVIPEALQRPYSEKIAYLPNAYLPNDRTRRIAEQTASRGEAGLPETGFVFCSFNNVYKIAPQIFACWMRLLTEVKDSVLWLQQANPASVHNLKREAAAQGISADRIIFAPFVRSAEDHLARLRLADLFLDTLPYNAHATACDALWAGVPVLTLSGPTFAGRVGASLLSAIGLPQLIARTLGEYEELALRLAREPLVLAEIKKRLARHRETHPLFDTARYTRDIEAAYTTMWQRHHNGEPPVSFAVSEADVAP